MGFLVAASLGFLVAAVLPLAIHLLARSPARRQSFPALRLVAMAAGGAQRRAPWRDALILLLRTLAIIACVLALAAPILDRAVATGQSPLVVVLDASLSLQQTSGGTTAFSRAQAAAIAVIDGRGGRPVLAVLADGRATASDATPHTDAAAAIALLRTATCGWGDGDLAGAVARASAALENGGEIVVVTDLARSSLSGVDPRALPTGLSLRVVGVDGGGPNQAIARLGLSPAQATPNSVIELAVDLRNHSDAAVELEMRIEAGGERWHRRASLAARGSTVVTQALRFASAGDHPVHAAIIARDAAGNVLAADDERWGVVRVRTGLSAAVVGASPADDARGATAPLLAAAQAAGFQPRVLRPDQFGTEAVDVLLTAGLSPAPLLAAQLVAHLEAGGVWLQCLDDAHDVALAQGLPGVRPPLAIGPAIDLVGRGTGALTIAGAKLDHPLMAAFFGREVLLAQAECYRLWSATSVPDATVLVTAEDGGVLLAERPVGAGRWLVLATSPAEARSNLAALDLLPLLIERLGTLAIPDRLADAARPCAALVAAIDGLTHRHHGPALVTAGRARLTWPGLYTAPDEALVAAGPPASESDLGPLDAGVLAQLGIAASGDTASADGKPLWHWLLLVAALCLLAELLLLSTPRVATAVRRTP